MMETAKDGNLEFVAAVCGRMQRVGLVTGKAEFSQRYLGHSPSYLTSMTARGRRVPGRVIEYLRDQIETTIATSSASMSGRAGKHLNEILRLTAGHQS